MSYKSQTEEKLKQVAKDLWAGKIFSDRHIKDPGNMLVSVFPVLGFMEKGTIKQMEKDEIEFIYEYLDKAGPRSVNGCPIFFSCRMLNGKDAKKMFAYYEGVKEKMDNI